LDYGEFTAYLTSVFEALSHTPAFQAHGATPAQMAAATAEQCFEEADDDGNGTLTFDEFKAWYEASPAAFRRSSSMTPADPNGFLNESDAAALFDEYDANGDGVLDFGVSF
jgi:Ca2+-binding EF-hand superfamily protein